jgi:hypothetical protein
MVSGDIINPRGEYWKNGDNMEHKGTSNLREERKRMTFTAVMNYHQNCTRRMHRRSNW